MEAYTHLFGFADDILLNTQVNHAKLNEDETWTIKAERTLPGGDSEQIEQAFDWLIVCNGIFSIPSIPDYEGVEAFQAAGGVICHTSEFVDPEIARDKNVLVVGYGKSSCDVANATVGISSNTTVVARSLIWKIPKLIGNVVNLKYIFQTRMSEALFRYIRMTRFEAFLHGVGLPIRNAMMNSIEWVIQRQFRLREIGLHPEKRLETIARSTISMVTPGFFENISAGRLGIRKATEIKALRAGEAELSSGETLPADLIVCGTGWHQQVPFLDHDIMEKVTDKEGNFRLFKSVLPLGVPNLLFNGYNSSFYSQLNAEVVSLWIAEYLQGGVTLPATERMNQWIDERLAWMKERTDGKHSKGTNIIPFSLHQIDELLKDINLELGVMKRFSQWFIPVVGSDFEHLNTRLQRRHGIGT